MADIPERGPKSRRGVLHVAEKLERTIEEGDYYHALQMYKTLCARYTAQHKTQELRELLSRGAKLLLQHNEINAGTELSLLYLENLTKSQDVVSESLIETILDIFQNYKADNHPGKKQFVHAACKWSGQPQNNKQGHPRLHDAFARSYHLAKEYELAQKHYLRGSDVAGFVSMIQEWSSQNLQVETDVLICRAVLLYLCLTDLKNANNFFNCAKTAVSGSPLLDFCSFLLQTLERDALPLFELLRQRYQIYLNKDQSLHQYLDHIAELYFGVKKADTGIGSMINNLLKSFMSDN